MSTRKYTNKTTQIAMQKCNTFKFIPTLLQTETFVGGVDVKLSYMLRQYMLVMQKKDNNYKEVRDEGKTVSLKRPPFSVRMWFQTAGIYFLHLMSITQMVHFVSLIAG